MGYAFISYSSRQQKDADRLRLLLHSNGIDTWMAPYDIPEGTVYADVINSAIEKAACFVLLLTEDTQNSTYVDKEVERALHYGKTIAPIQLDRVTLNDSFSFYLCNQQIIMVSAIDDSEPKVQRLLQHLTLLCQERLPPEIAPDAVRDKRVRRHNISRLCILLGILLLCASLFCGHQYLDMAHRATNVDVYGTKYIPDSAEIARYYGVFLLLALAGAGSYLYGHGLKDPQKKTWNPIRLFPRRKILPVLSVLCGAGSALLVLARRSAMEIIRGLSVENMPTEGYLPPQWVTPAARTLAIGFLAGASVSLVLAFVRAKRNGFVFLRSLRRRFLMSAARRKRGEK